MIGSARIIAIEGTHGTGKTTLAYALAAALAAKGHPINLVGEVVRSSPWFQDALLRGDGMVDEHAFVHLFADQLRREIEAALHTTYVVLDRTVLSCLGYWHLRSRQSTEIVGALERVTSLHTAKYDLVVYCNDMYPLEQLGDPFRSVDEDFRQLAQESIGRVVNASRARAHQLPIGLSSVQKVDWIEQLLAAPAEPSGG